MLLCTPAFSFSLSMNSAGVSHTGKRRRQAKDFPGADIIIPQIKAKTARKRVGLVSTGPPVRQHTPILSPDGKVIGQNVPKCKHRHKNIPPPNNYESIVVCHSICYDVANWGLQTQTFSNLTC